MHSSAASQATEEILFLPYAKDLRKQRSESVLLLLLNEKLELIAQHTITQQHAFQTEFCTRAVFMPALIHGADNIVILHNHPSGSVLPSPADYLTTVVLAHAATILQITVVDHLIVTEKEYYSFRKAGIL